MTDSPMPAPSFEAAVCEPRDAAVDMLFVPVFSDEESLDDVPGLDEAMAGWFTRVRANGEFRGKLYESFIARADGWKAARIALVGAGSRGGATPERLRKIAAACGYTARLRAVATVGWVVRRVWNPVDAAQAAADGLSAAEFDAGVLKRATEPEGR